MNSGTVYHPEIGQLMQWEVTPLSSDPDTQVAQTVSRMAGNVREDAGSAPILNDALAIQGSGSGDPLSDTFWWNKRRLGFRHDRTLAQPFRPFLDDEVVEVLIRPRDLAQMRQPLEDCDGFASLAAAQLRAQGIPCNFVTVAADTREPGRFSHVYLACYPESGERIALDVSHGPYPGWEATDTGQVTRLKEWSIDGPGWGEVLLIGAAILILAKLCGVI